MRRLDPLAALLGSALLGFALLGLALLLLLPLGACRDEIAPALPTSALRGPRAPAGAALYLQFPLFDQRIERVDPRQPAERQRYYPDRWQRDVRAVRDFAVDARRLYVLLARWDRSDDARLYVVDRAAGTLSATVALPSQPALVDWVAAARLAVCHATPSSGPAGRLTLIDTRPSPPKVLQEIALDGACQAVAAASGQIFVLARAERQLALAEVLLEHYLLAIDAQSGARRLARALPAGARSLALGPSGLLYVAFASGSGRHATDNTVGVYEPAQLTLVDRLRPQMLVRTITPAGQGASGLLLLSLLHESEGWLSAVRSDHSGAFELRFGRLTGGEGAVVDGVAYFPLRGEHALERITVPAGQRLPRLSLGAQPQGRDPIGLLRSVLTFPVDDASPTAGGH